MTSPSALDRDGGPGVEFNRPATSIGADDRSAHSHDALSTTAQPRRVGTPPIDAAADDGDARDTMPKTDHLGYRDPASPEDRHENDGADYRDLRRQVPLFAAAGALSLLTGFIPFPRAHEIETLVTGGIFFTLTILAVALPWTRLPQWAWTLVPICYVGVIALLRDVQGATPSGLTALFFLPIVWLAFYGKRSYLVAGILSVTAALIVPIVVLGPPVYPDTTWRPVVVIITGITLVSFTLLELVKRDRLRTSQLNRQSRRAQREARQAEAAREQMASLLRAATETAIIGTDATGTITFFSDGAEKLLGRRAHDVIGTLRLADLFDASGTHEPSDTLDLLTATEGTPDRVAEGLIWTFTRPDGAVRRMSAAVTRLPMTTPPPSQTAATGTDGAPPDDLRSQDGAAGVDGDGNGAEGVGGFVVVASDVTEREELVIERERLLAVQNEVTQVLVDQNDQLRELTKVKDDVVATVSHEIRTPLTSIRGFIELLLAEDAGELEEAQVRMLRTIDRNSRQLLRVADDLLEDPSFGKGLRVHFAETDLASIARDDVEAQTRTALAKGVTLSVDADRPVLVLGDATRLHQLIANLVANAVKFTPAGRRVHVRVRSLGQFARVEVQDEGPGIPANERQALFERFYRLASTTEQGIPGSGLGLAIAKSVVDAHNGTIQIIDTPEWSTTFRIHLPGLEPAALTAPASAQLLE